MDEPDEELLEAGAPRRVPRAVWAAAAALVVAAGVVAAVVTVSGSSDTPSPTPTPTPDGPAAVRDVAVAADHGFGLVYRLRGARIEALDPDGRVTARSEPVPADLLRGDVALAVDEGSTGHAVWLVPLGATGQGRQVEAYTGRTLARIGSATLVAGVDSAAAAGGSLAVAGRDGRSTRLLSTDTTGGVLLATPVEAFLVAPDPARDRVLALSTAGPLTRVLALGTDGPTTAAATTTGPAPSLVAADGTIWAGDGSGRLERLSPSTLRPLASAPPEARGPHVVAVAAGDRSLFVRPTQNDPRLLCLDPRDGHVLDSWARAPGQVAASRGRVYHLIPGTQAVALPSGDCPG